MLAIIVLKQLQVFVVCFVNKAATFFMFFQELADIGFAQMALDRETSIIDVVDENGNIWNCTLSFSMDPAPNFKIGGGWELMVKARRFTEGARVVIGAPAIGLNLTLYFCVIRC
jgi:hypothetical protein